ncbi:MAG: dihydropteroate synthase [Propionibacterium sp.]|nr:MAG: dihydropteroate synthase [Propionibacterium sp.]
MAAGASIINDVSGGLADEKMFSVVANSEVDYVVMHWRGHSDVMTQLTDYVDVVAQVRTELLNQVAAAEKSGVKSERIIIDTGIGFAKTSAQNWELLRNIDQFNQLGYRQLVGVSRKRFLGELVNREAQQRDSASAAVTSWCAQHQVWAVRVHTIDPHLDAIAVTEMLSASADQYRSPKS